MQELLECQVLLAHGIRHANERAGSGAHVFDRGHARGVDAPARFLDQVVDDRADHATDYLVDEPPVFEVRIEAAHLAVSRVEQRMLAQLRKRQQARAVAVVDVMVVVGDGVGDVRDLRLEPRLCPLEEAPAHVAERARVALRAVFENAFASFEHEVQARKVGVLGFQLIDDAQGLQVVFEATVLAHAGVECVLPGMAERRMPEIVRQADRLGQRLVEPQRVGNRASNLRHLERMCQSRAIQVALVIDEHLRLVHEPPERGRVNDAIAIALVLAAVGRWRLFYSAAATARLVCGEGSKALHHQAALTSSSRRRWS